jgi:hypothetical protein
MSTSASADDRRSGASLDILDDDVPQTPVTYHKSATQIVVGIFVSQHVACLLWSEHLAKKAAQAHVLKSRLERAKRVFDDRRRNLVAEERDCRRAVTERLRELHKLQLRVARQQQKPSTLQQKQLRDLGDSWREALQTGEDLAHRKYLLEIAFQAMNKEYCDTLEAIHS